MKTKKIIFAFCMLVFVLPVSVFGQSYTLQQVKDSAIKNNLSLLSAQNSILQSRETKKETFTNYFPKVSAVGGYFKSNKDLVEINMSNEQLQALQQTLQQMPSLMAFVPTEDGYIDDGFMASVSAIQPVFMGGRIINGNKLAKIGLEVDSLKYNLSKNEIDLLSETYFWQVISLENKLKTVNSAIEMLESLKKDVNLAVKSGIRTKNDLLQVELKLNETEVTRIKITDGIKLAKMLLAQHMGLDLEEDFSLIAENLNLNEENLSTDVKSTNEYLLLQKNFEAKQLMKNIEIGSNLPSLAVGVTYAYNNLLDKDYKRGFAFATLSIPISDWWKGSHRIKKKNLEIRNAENELENNSQKLRLRIQQTYNEMTACTKELNIMQESISQAEENLRNHKNFYSAGTITMSELLQAQMLYLQTKNSYEDCLADYRIKILKYKQAIGK